MSAEDLARGTPIWVGEQLEGPAAGLGFGGFTMLASVWKTRGRCPA
jgi:hypothetical protein